jgi:hydroxymethylbilane synthase
LDIRELRGNVDTRIEKLRRGDYDAIVLAKAGLDRLGLAANISEVLPSSVSLPAAGQGAISIESRSGDEDVLRSLAKLDHAETRCGVEAERAVLARLEGGCQVSIGTWGRVEKGMLVLEVAVLSPDGAERLYERRAGPPASAKQIGQQVSETLLARGAGELLKREVRRTVV